MNLKEMIEGLTTELDIEMPKINEEKAYSLILHPDISVFVYDQLPGMSLRARIAMCPTEKKEDLLIYLMKANFLCQGTGGARIGLEADDKFLTLSHGFPYEMNYQLFKESVEDFVNFVMFWREEIAKFEREK